MVFYEAPHKLAQTLGDLCAFFGEERPVALCREMTKLHEEVIRTTNDFGEVMRKSKELPNLETTVEKVNDEFIKNPLVSFKTLFGWGDDEDEDEGKSSPAKMSPASDAGDEAAESGESEAAESSAPAAVPANASADGE